MPEGSADGGRPMHLLELPAPPGRPTLLFLHGAGGDHTVWGAQIAAFRGRAGVLAPDLPSHGRSPGPPAASIEALARAVAARIAGREPEDLVIVGHSMGGAVALELALGGAGRGFPAGLVLAGTSAKLTVSQQVLDLVESDAQAAVARIARFAYALGTDPELIARGAEHLRRCDPATLLADFRACNAFDARERLGAVRAPALVVCGSEDRLTFPLQAEWMAARLPHAQYRPLAGAGHLVMIERPGEFTGILDGWLEARFPPASGGGVSPPPQSSK